MDLKEDFKNMCDTVADTVMAPLVMQKEFVYIDTDLLFDYRFGALMAYVSNEEDYNYVQEHLQEYIDAPSLECAKFFPKLGVTEKDLDGIIEDPNYHTFITAASPMTNAFRDLPGVIRTLSSINKTKDTRHPIRFTFNQRKFRLHDSIKEDIIKIVHTFDRSYIVDFTEFKSWFEVPTEFLKLQDFICVYDIREFLQEGSTSQKLMTDEHGYLGSTDIVTLMQSDEKPEKLEESLENLKAVMEMMCEKFSFIKKSILNIAKKE